MEENDKIEDKRDYIYIYIHIRGKNEYKKLRGFSLVNKKNNNSEMNIKI